MTFAFLLLLLAFQEDIAVENLDSVSLGEKFNSAYQKFNTVERNEARDIFEELVTLLEARGSYSEEERLILTESLKCLGVIDFPERTEEYFEKLIRFDADYVLNSRDLSPKIVAVFTRLKEALVGTLAVTAADADTGAWIEGAVLVVDGVEVGAILGATNFSVFTGSRLVEVRRPNYETYVQDMEVAKNSRLEAVMKRNAAELMIVTSPADVEVFLETESRGFTTGEVPSYYNRPLTSEGINRNEAGSLVIDGLQPGRYTLTFKKSCFKPLVATKEITDFQQLNVSPVKMEPAGARLTVRTNGDNDGIVYLDQKRIGYLPIENHLICPDDYTLKVSFTDGEYIKQITVADGESREFMAEPLPSIAWFGLQDESEGRPPVEISEILLGLKTWNVWVVDPRDTTAVPINPFPALFDAPVIDERGKQALTRQVKADLFMAARVVRQKVLIRNLEIAFWTPLSDRIHIKSFDFREADKLEKMIASLDIQPALTKPWLGIQTARLQGLQGCRIIEVDPNGPLAGQVQPGELVAGVNGNVLRNPNDLTSLEEIAEVSLDVGGSPGQGHPNGDHRRVTLRCRGGSYRRHCWPNWRNYSNITPTSLCATALASTRRAFASLSGMSSKPSIFFTTMQLPAAYGINQGTLLFYQGLCFRQLKTGL